MATPNVTAAENSAPNATVTATQPAQSGGAPASTMTAVPASTAAPLTAAPAAPSKTTAEEQATLKKVTADAKGKDYFEQQEIFAKAFEEREGEDSFRRAARIEREREAAASAGDPTRDPVAKQKAMDENTVLPGAAADAQKIKNVGADKAAEAAKAAGTK